VVVRIGTRGSALALAQTATVRSLLEARGATVEVEIIKTTGDLVTDRPLVTIGGKGLFVKEIEQALTERRIDLAVHSLKDVPHTQPPGLTLCGVLPREEVRDALVLRPGDDAARLLDGGRIGTGSLRREAQLRELFPACDILPLRGNVDTRLRRLDQGDYDAVVLAAAGLRRLGKAGRITRLLDCSECLPAGGQATIGLEIRSEDQEMARWVASLTDARCWDEVRAERAFLRELDCDCHTPVAVYAALQDDGRLWLRGALFELVSRRRLDVESFGPRADAALLGRRVAELALERGARELLRAAGPVGTDN